MGLFTTSIKSMDDLFLHPLRDIYYAENQIVKNLPSMIEKATNRELAGGLKSHLEGTRKQVERLEQVFEKLGQKPKAVDCPAMDGILEEAEEIAGDVADKQVLDAGIIARRRPSSTMRSHATARSSPGRKNSVTTKWCGSSTRT